MYWANFIHIYQPPTQTEAIVRKVTEECYRKLVSVLKEAPQARITLNISAVLTKHLANLGYSDVMDGIRELAERGQIELTGSAMYHPILPLIPLEEVVRQIELNTKLNRLYLGEVYHPRGFFLPEMCYSLDVAKMVGSLGFEWILVDEIAFEGKIGWARKDTTYYISGASDLKVFFKERPFSAGLAYGKFPAYETFIEALDRYLNSNVYLLTGTDGEIYGHHRPGQERLLQEVFQAGRPATCTISELLDLFPGREMATPLASSWSTWEDEMAAGIPYPQWQYPGNEIHHLQWRLTTLAIEVIHKYPKSEGYNEARQLLDEGLHSCQYWWASCRPWWDTGMIECGARRLLDAALAIADASPEEKGTASRLFRSVVDRAKHWQDSGKAAALKSEYLDEHKDVTSELTFGHH